MERIRSPRVATAGRIAWIAVAIWVLVYAPMAAEFMSRYFTDGPELWDHAFAGVAGDRHALGAGSIHAVQMENYRDNATTMVTHTVLGAAAISLCVFQLSGLSRRRPGVHRRIGRFLIAAVTVSMAAALAFLLAVGPTGTYDGPAFYVQLWALALGSLAGGWLGFHAIRRRQVASHRILMTYLFALLCTAPFLRLGYLVLGVAWPDVTQEVTNLAGAAILGFLAPSTVVLAARFVPAGRNAADRDDPFGPRERILLTGVGLAGLLALITAYASAFDGVDRITISWTMAGVVALVVALRGRRHAADATARRDWGFYLAAIKLAMPLTGILWVLYQLAFDTEASFYGALLTGPPTTISLAVVAIAYGRWQPAPARRSSPLTTRTG